MARKKRLDPFVLISIPLLISYVVFSTLTLLLNDWTYLYVYTPMLFLGGLFLVLGIKRTKATAAFPDEASKKIID